jgi:hypothetical protein
VISLYFLLALLGLSKMKRGVTTHALSQAQACLSRNAFDTPDAGMLPAPSFSCEIACFERRTAAEARKSVIGFGLHTSSFEPLSIEAETVCFIKGNPMGIAWPRRDGFISPRG